MESPSDDSEARTSEELDNLQRILAGQWRYCRRAEHELESDGRKTSHWAWPIFPHDEPGRNDPSGGTSLTHKTVADMVHQAPSRWRTVIELVTQLSVDNGTYVLPPDDHPRVTRFARLMLELNFV